MNYFERHLIQCQCVLPQFKNITKPLFHKFPVFSEYKINDNSEIIFEKKYVKCNNCDVIHKVEDFCKSNINWGKENIDSLITTKEDLKYLIPDNILSVLELNRCDISIWENIYFFIENNVYDVGVIINKEEIQNEVVCKIISLNKDNTLKLKKKIYNRDL